MEAMRTKMTRYGTVRYGTNPQNRTLLDPIPDRARVIHWKLCNNGNMLYLLDILNDILKFNTFNVVVFLGAKYVFEGAYHAG